MSNVFLRRERGLNISRQDHWTVKNKNSVLVNAKHTSLSNAEKNLFYEIGSVFLGFQDVAWL